MSVNLNKVLGQ